MQYLISLPSDADNGNSLWKVIMDSLDPTSVGIRLWPKQISFYAYRTILTKKSLYQPFLVSIYTTVAATAVGLLMTTLAAYVILQKEMPGRRLMIAYIMFTMLFSGDSRLSEYQKSGTDE